MGKELKNEFSWSKSRHDTFHECHRKYFFQYYGSWGGWNRDASPRARELYVLKNLDSRFTWAGRRVHSCIESILKQLKTGGELPAEAVTVEGLLQQMREDFKQSRAGAYRQNPKKACGFFEHEYEAQVPDDEWKRIAEKSAACVRAFYASPLLEKIRKLPEEDWLEIEEFSGFVLDGLRVFVQLDFAFKENDHICIYDWKTGKPDAQQNEIQLACYVLYAVDKWKISPELVSATALYLPDGTEIQGRIDAERLETMKEFIRESAEEMLFPLADPQNNVPDEEDVFEFADDPRACKRCNFLKVCPKWQ